MKEVLVPRAGAACTANDVYPAPPHPGAAIAWVLLRQRSEGCGRWLKTVPSCIEFHACLQTIALVMPARHATPAASGAVTSAALGVVEQVRRGSAMIKLEDGTTARLKVSKQRYFAMGRR